MQTLIAAAEPDPSHAAQSASAGTSIIVSSLENYPTTATTITWTTESSPITGGEPVTLPEPGAHVMRFRIEARDLRRSHIEVMGAWLRSLGLNPDDARAIAVFDTDGRYLLHANCLRRVDGRAVIDWAADEVATEPIVIDIEDWPEELNEYAPGRLTWMRPGATHIPVTERAA